MDERTQQLEEILNKIGITKDEWFLLIKLTEKSQEMPQPSKKPFHNRISELLFMFDFPTNVGFCYLCDAIEIVSTFPEKANALEAAVYSQIAKKNNTTTKAVYHAIWNIVNQNFWKIDAEFRRQYFNNLQRISSGKFIKVMANHLHLEGY